MNMTCGRRSASCGVGVSCTASMTITVPSTLAPGTYCIGAIADSTGVQPEAKEAGRSRKIHKVAVPAVVSARMKSGLSQTAFAQLWAYLCARCRIGNKAAANPAARPRCSSPLPSAGPGFFWKPPIHNQQTYSPAMLLGLTRCFGCDGLYYLPGRPVLPVPPPG
jgi:hypothetical protein